MLVYVIRLLRAFVPLPVPVLQRHVPMVRPEDNVPYSFVGSVDLVVPSLIFVGNSV